MKQVLPAKFPLTPKADIGIITKIIKRLIKPEYIILFGSYARGNFVEYDETLVNGGQYIETYQSDLDILVIVTNTKVEKDFRLWKQIDDEINRKTTTPVDLIVHTVQFVNEQLSHGVPFFLDIKKEGIILFTRGKTKLVNAKKLAPDERKKMAEEDLKRWMTKGHDFYELYKHLKEELEPTTNRLNLAAFNLHQATEHFFIAIQLVFTRYNPKAHDIEKLSNLAAHFGFDIHNIFPQDTEEEKHLFELLRRSYVDARYSPSFSISEKELEILAERVLKIGKEIEKLCRERIAKMA